MAGTGHLANGRFLSLSSLLSGRTDGQLIERLMLHVCPEKFALLANKARFSVRLSALGLNGDP